MTRITHVGLCGKWTPDPCASSGRAPSARGPQSTGCEICDGISAPERMALKAARPRKSRSTAFGGGQSVLWLNTP